MQGAGTILQDLPWSSWQESRMQNALVPNRCLVPGVVPPLNSPSVHECCLFVCRAGRCTGLGTRGFEMHPRCEGKARERILLCSPLFRQGSWAHFGNVTEHTGAQQADWEKQRPNPPAGLETSPLPRPPGTPTPYQTGGVHERSR